ncbi:MAG TPA: hypothetical protein VGZ02_09050 [Candidatus Baltobacteraceae bacterium]|jgi:8-oxo-dGTP pyrophosphatase MutT (NUDIX family)|nr:hypothetical protein [Candidatus Baltobacteraceae bacterium]
MVRLAATVMLVRPAGQTFEVFMLRRSEASHFAPDVYVFPGGTLDAADTAAEMLNRTKGVEPAAVRAQFRAQTPANLPAPDDGPTDREAAGLLVAGLRELFEEAGVLLACDASGCPWPDAHFEAGRTRLHEAREKVASGRMRFDQLLEELDVYANAHALALFSQWITPPVYPRRYNTHFFVALAGGDQAAAADAYETHDGVWIAPKTALARYEEGAFRMVYPTVKHIERLAEFDDAAALLEFARNKPIYRVMPQTPGAHQFALPPELERAW